MENIDTRAALLISDVTLENNGLCPEDAKTNVKDNKPDGKESASNILAPSAVILVEIRASMSGINLHENVDFGERYHTHKKPFMKLKTGVLLIAFIILGIQGVIVGVTFLDMMDLFDVDTKTLGLTFLAEGAGFLMGALIGGALYDHLQGHIQLAVLCLIKGLALCVAPWNSTFGVFVAFMALSSFSNGYLQVANQPYVLDLWCGHSARPAVIQARSFATSLGATIGPFLYRPFLFDDSQDIAINESENIMNEINITFKPATETRYVDVRGAYVLAGLPLLMPAISLFLFALQERPLIQTRKPHLSQLEIMKKNTPCRRRILLALFCCYSFSYLWQEVTLNGYLTVFITHMLNWHKKLAVQVNSVMWGALGCGRLLGVLLASRLRPALLLFINMFLTMIGLLTLLLITPYPNLIWLSVSLIGFGLSTVFATMITWASQLILIDGVASAVIIGGEGLAIMSGPSLTGFLVQKYGAQWIIYSVGIALSFAIVIYTALQVLQRAWHMKEKKLANVVYIPATL